MPGVVSYLDLDPAKFRTQVKKVVSDLDKTDRSFDKTGGKANSLKKIIGGVFAGFSVALVVNKLRQVGTAVIDTGSQFETLGILLQTHFGDRAGAVFDEIKEFALDSPAQVSQITSAWIGLQSVGVTPTIGLMKQLDDVASSAVNAATGQTRNLAELAEAIRKAVTGETESLKAFNVIARLQGEQITLAYKNTRAQVERTADAVSEAIAKIGRDNFGGAAAKQMNSAAGAASNLEDALDLLKDKLFGAGGIGSLLTDATLAATGWVGALEPGAVEATKKWTQALRDLKTIADALPEQKDGFFAALLRNAPIGGALQSFFDSLDQGRQELRELADALDGDTEAMKDLEEAAAEAQKTLSRADRIRDRAKARFEEAKAATALAKALEDLPGVADQISAAKLAAEIEKQAEAWHKLLDEQSPGIAALKEIAAQEIVTAAAAKAGAEATKAAEAAAKARVEMLEAEAEAFHQLALARQRYTDLPPIPTLAGGVGEFVPPALGEDPRFRQVGDVIETTAGSMEIIRRDMEGTAEAGVDWADALWDASGIFADMNTDLGDTLAGLTRAASMMADMARDGLTWQEGVTVGLEAAQGFDLGTTGNTVADYAQIGNSFWPGWGALVGAFVGLAVDTMDHLSQTFVDADTTSGIAQVRTVSALGSLDQRVVDMMQFVADTFNQIISDIGGVVDSFETFAIVVRENGDIGVWVNEVHTTVATIGEAIDFLITGLIKETEISGLSDVVRSALENFGGQTVDELERVLTAALSIENLNLDAATLALKNQLRGLNDTLFTAITEIGAGAQDVLMGSGGIVGTIQSAYDQLFGIQPDIEAQTRNRIEMLQTQIQVERAQLLAMAAQIDGIQAMSSARVGSAKVDFAITKAIGISAEASAAALAAISGAVAALDQLLSTGFSTRAIEEAIRRASRGSGGGGARRDTGYLGSVEARQARRAEILAELAGRSATEAGRMAEAIAAAALEMQKLSTFSAEQIQAMRDLMAGQSFADFTDPLLEAIQRSGETAAETERRLLEERVAAQIQIAEEFAAEEIWNAEQLAEALALIEEAAAIERTRIAEAEAEAERNRIEAEAEAELRRIEEINRRREEILAPFREDDQSLSGRLAAILQAEQDALAALEDVIHTREDEIVVIEGTQRAIQDLNQAAFAQLETSAAGVVGILRQALPFLPDAEAERIQQTLLEYEQLIFELTVKKAEVELQMLRAELEALGILGQGQAEWIDRLLGDLGIIGDHMQDIFDGMADDVRDAGQDFARSVGSSSPFGPGLVPLIPIGPIPTHSPPRTSQDIGLELAALMAQLNALLNPADQLSPAEQLMEWVERMGPFFEAFGLNLEEITAQIQEMIDADLGSAAADWAAFQDAALHGPGSGRSDSEVLSWIRGQVLQALADGDVASAIQWAQQGIQLANSLPGFQAQAFLDFIQGAQLGGGQIGGGPGTVDPPGGPGQTGENFTARMDVFEQATYQRHLAEQDARATIVNAVEQSSDRVVGAILGTGGRPQRGRGTSRRVVVATVHPLN